MPLMRDPTLQHPPSPRLRGEGWGEGYLLDNTDTRYWESAVAPHPSARPTLSQALNETCPPTAP